MVGQRLYIGGWLIAVSARRWLFATPPTTLTLALPMLAYTALIRREHVLALRTYTNVRDELTCGP